MDKDITEWFCGSEKKIMILKKLFSLLFLVLLLLPIAAFFHSGLPLTHDGQDHVARIANFYSALSDGVIVPRWAENLNWGYGHPVLQFLYPLPSYIASAFHFVGFSFVDSVKMVMGMGMIFSFVFMYLWLSQFSSKYAALIGAFLYTYAPYRFVEIYVRGDIGENLAFAFIPLTLLFIYKFSKKQTINNFLLISISLALLILAHNAISLISIPFILLYGLILCINLKNKREYLIKFFISFFLGFMLSAFFWIPALLEGKFTLRNIVTKGGYINHFVDIPRLIYGPWDFGGSGAFTVQLGFIQWFVLFGSFISAYVFRKDKIKLLLISILLLFTFASIFIMLPYSNFIWEKFILLQNFQFPWRFLGLIVFTTAVLSVYLVEILSKKVNIKIITVFVVAGVLIASIPYFTPKGYLYKNADFYTGIYNSTTDTGESAPIWSVRFMEKRPRAHIEVIEGVADVQEIKRTANLHEYKINVLEDAQIKENTLFFPGWKIYANGQVVNVQFQNPEHRGIMLFNLPKGEYFIKVVFGETKLRLVSDALSIFAFGVLVLVFCINLFVKRKIN